MHVCMYICIYVCMFVRMYVCMYDCLFICLYICMYVLRVRVSTALGVLNHAGRNKNRYDNERKEELKDSNWQFALRSYCVFSHFTD